MQLIGWTGAWTSQYNQAPLTEEKKLALIGIIRKRGYNFTYDAHQTLPAAAPFYSDKTLCVLTKKQWDEVMNEAYKDAPRGPRLMPMDVITRSMKNSVLYEKEKFEPKEG